MTARPDDAPPAVPDSAPAFFGAMVEAYDDFIRRVVPRYEDMTARLVEYLPERATRVLELGCGTGALSLALVARYPSARFTFVDAAAEMVTITRQRVERADAAAAARADFVVARFEEVALDAGSHDLVASSLSLHHVVDKGALYHRLHALLLPGGRLCVADQLRSAHDAHHQRDLAGWLAFCRAPGHCSEPEFASLLAHVEAHDHYVMLTDHLTMLATAGFVELDCVWRDRMLAILSATAA